MGAKRSIDLTSKKSEDKLSVPPGFVSLTSFTLKRIANSGLAAEPGLTGDPLSNLDIEKLKTPFWQSPGMLHDQIDRVSAKRDSEQIGDDSKCSSSPPLPKEVTRGCAKCHDSVKVSARWHPEESCLPVLNDAPVFYPTEEEFKDTLKYIAIIRPKAENFGICRIVPPPSWRPPCLLKAKRKWKDLKFCTRVQKIDGLQHAYLKRKLSRMADKMETKRPKVMSRMGLKPCDKHVLDTVEAKCTKLESGTEFSLQSFKSYADDFKSHYFRSFENVMDPNDGMTQIQGLWEPLVSRVEGEYWRISNNPSEEIEVLCGNNMETQTLGSGFPIKDNPADNAEHSKYVKSGWNLNNIPKLSGSLLPFGCYGTSDILIPQLSVGMCFATRCWRKAEHHLYSLCYMHFGDPKVWYGIPGRYCFKFVEVMKKLFPQLSKHPQLLHELVTQLSPSTLKSEGIPVYRCVQNPLEFVLIFPGAYHSFFDAGFNCSEAVCFAPFDWLPHGQNIVELYSDYGWKTSFSHDRLLLGAAMEAVAALWESYTKRNDSSSNQLWRSACGKNGILTKALKSRIELEGRRREHLCHPSHSKAFDDFPAATKRECTICSYDLYLSAVGCSCSPNVYTCLRHGKQLCSCAWGAKCFYFRFEMEELNLLVEALEEDNLKAIHWWAKRKIRLSPDSFSSKECLNMNGEPSSFDCIENKAVTEIPDSNSQSVSDNFNTSVGTLTKKIESVAVSSSAPDVILLSDDED